MKLMAFTSSPITPMNPFLPLDAMQPLMVFEDTGERRYPHLTEYYVYLDPSGFRVLSYCLVKADWATAEEYAIYRLVKPRPSYGEVAGAVAEVVSALQGQLRPIVEELAKLRLSQPSASVAPRQFSPELLRKAADEEHSAWWSKAAQPEDERPPWE
jgi:hypothetical protein